VAGSVGRRRPARAHHRGGPTPLSDAEPGPHDGEQDVPAVGEGGRRVGLDAQFTPAREGHQAHGSRRQYQPYANATRRKKPRSGKTGTPPPWWGKGDAPVRRWPGFTIAIPSVWSRLRRRWESPNGAYYFDPAAAAFAEGFFPTFLEHHIGAFDGKPFELLPYQRLMVVRPLFDWRRVSDGLRRFRKVFLAVPKGSGKSPFGAGLGLFGAFFDGEPGAEVYAVAADRKQAGIVFDSAKVRRNGTST
jgi:hypothetical protein